MMNETETPTQPVALEVFAGILTAGRRAMDLIAADADSAASARAFRALQAARAELEKGTAP